MTYILKRIQWEPIKMISAKLAFAALWLVSIFDYQRIHALKMGAVARWQLVTFGTLMLLPILTFVLFCIRTRDEEGVELACLLMLSFSILFTDASFWLIFKFSKLALSPDNALVIQSTILMFEFTALVFGCI